MKFDSSYRNSQRADYEQFAKFIGGQHVAREVSGAVPTMAYQPAECKSRPIAMVYCENQEWAVLAELKQHITIQVPHQRTEKQREH